MSTLSLNHSEATEICSQCWRDHAGDIDPATEPVDVLRIIYDNVRRKEPTIGCPLGEILAWSMGVVVECVDGKVRFMEVLANGRHSQYGKDWDYQIYFPGVLENRKTDHENQGSRSYLSSLLAGC